MTTRVQIPPFFPAILIGAVLISLQGCVYEAPELKRAPGGGYYVSQQPKRASWNMNWGLVKADKRPVVAESKSYWRGDGVPGKPRITIDLSEQMAYFHKGSQLVGASPVCTGSPRFPTPRGSFRVIEKDADHYSSVYGDYIDSTGNVLMSQIDNRKDRRPPGARFDGAKMFWFMRIVGGVGMHEGYLPGYADSHGCIRLPSSMARIFYQNAPLGTPVRVIE